MFRYNEWMYTQEENQIEKYLFCYILYALNVSESIITFARKRLNFKESIFLPLFSVSTKFYKYAIHSSFTHMLNMGQLRVQTRRCEYYPIFTHTRTCGQGQEIVTGTSLRIFAHENSFRDPALWKAARIDSDCWKEMQSSGILPKQINLALKRSLISFHLFLLNIGLLNIVIGKGRFRFLQRFSNVSRFAHVRGSTSIVSETRLAAVHELRNVDRGQNRGSIGRSSISARYFWIFEMLFRVIFT